MNGVHNIYVQMEQLAIKIDAFAIHAAQHFFRCVLQANGHGTFAIGV